MKSTQVAKVEDKGTALALSADSFSEFANSGFENVTTKDLLVPRLTILQALSPQVQKKKTEYIEGSELGDICDTGLGAIYKELLFLPVYYRMDFLEWAPRSSGKGLVEVHADASILDKCTQNEKRQWMLPNGNYVAETAQMFGFNLSDGGRPSFIAFTGTQHKKVRKWLSLATGEKLKRGDGTVFTPPLFYRAYSLRTGEESNNEGDWFGWIVNRSGSLPELDLSEIGMDWKELKDKAAKFKEQLASGEAKADTSSMEAEGKTASGEEGVM